MRCFRLITKILDKTDSGKINPLFKQTIKKKKVYLEKEQNSSLKIIKEYLNF